MYPRMTWNQIVNAVYRNEWQLVERAVSARPNTRPDSAHDMAEHLGHIVAQRLYRNQPECLVETVTWLTRQPYLNRQTFAEWVALDALKRTDSALHRRIGAVVYPHCRRERLIEIAFHLTECDSQEHRAFQARKGTCARDIGEALAACAKSSPRKTGGVYQLIANDPPCGAIGRVKSATHIASYQSYCTVQ